MTAFPNLPTAPLGLRRILKFDVSQRLCEDLTLERIFRSRVCQHSWEISWPGLTPAQRAILDAFFVTCRGRILGDISYVDPFDGVTYTCRLDQDELPTDEMAPLSVWTGSLRLTEVASFKALKDAVAVFPSTVPFQKVYRMHRRYSTVIEPRPNATEARYEDWSSSIQRWAVGGDGLTDAQTEDLLDCFEGNCGPYREFEFTEPQTDTLYENCHFVETEAIHTMTVPGVNSLRLTVEELK